ICFAVGWGNVRTFDVATGKELAAFRFNPIPWLAAGWYDNDERYDLYLQPTPAGMAYARASPDGRFLASEVQLETRPKENVKWISRVDAMLWEAHSGQEIAHLKGNVQPYVSPDGELMVTVGRGALQFWGLPPRRPIVPFLVATALLISLCAFWWLLRVRVLGI